MALPVIRTIQDTQLELHNDPNTSGLRKLGRLSPLFRRIWNEPSETVDGIMTGGQTFQIVCIEMARDVIDLTDIFADSLIFRCA